MNPVIIDKDTGAELWRSIDCANHCGITPATWGHYHINNRAPQPVTMLDKRTPLWDAKQVKQWHANRPGKPGRPAKQ